LFKRWIALSSGQITIHWITQLVLRVFIRRIVIYPVDSAIHRLNNRGQVPNHLLHGFLGVPNNLLENVAEAAVTALTLGKTTFMYLSIKKKATIC